MPRHYKKDELTTEQILDEVIAFIEGSPHTTKISHISRDWKKYTRQHLYKIGVAKDQAVRESLDMNRELLVDRLCLEWLLDSKAHPTLRIVAMKLLLLNEDQLRKLNIDYAPPTQEAFASLIKRVSQPKLPSKN